MDEMDNIDQLYYNGCNLYVHGEKLIVGMEYNMEEFNNMDEECDYHPCGQIWHG